MHTVIQLHTSSGGLVSTVTCGGVHSGGDTTSSILNSPKKLHRYSQ